MLNWQILLVLKPIIKMNGLSLKIIIEFLFIILSELDVDIFKFRGIKA